MLATIPSATVRGARGRCVTVEVHVATGLPAVTMVGQPSLACREGLQRVRVAFNIGALPWPGDTRKVTINLAPPDCRKLGSGLDLAIAIGIAFRDRSVKKPINGSGEAAKYSSRVRNSIFVIILTGDSSTAKCLRHWKRAS